jgi:hypothetical protein
MTLANFVMIACVRINLDSKPGGTSIEGIQFFGMEHMNGDWQLLYTGLLQIVGVEWEKFVLI